MPPSPPHLMRSRLPKRGPGRRSRKPIPEAQPVCLVPFILSSRSAGACSGLPSVTALLRSRPMLADALAGVAARVR